MPSDESERRSQRPSTGPASGPLEAWLSEVLVDLAGPVQRMRAALLSVAPVVFAFLALLDPAPWRIALLVTTLVGVALLSAVSWWGWRTGRAGQRTWSVNAVLMAWFQLLVIGATGGLQSPLLPALPVVALQASLVFGAHWPRAAVLAGQVLAIAAFAGSELAGAHLGLPGLSSRLGPGAVAFEAAVLPVVLAVAAFVGGRIRAVVATMVARVSAAAEGERRAHTEHARELMLLSAEIAHELKNPLASIHGLSALLAKDLVGRDAERLAVLREEVERMKATLEAFLDFSRPIAPLLREEVALDGLAREVATLCEGLARGREVALVVTGEGAASADRRKLRQVLVNLVQNAIEAAPPRSVVELAAAPGLLEVRDRGPGVSGELRERVFEAGVTDKPQGSGLGLTIARALLRQHQGDLVLLPRDGGGTIARATLPEAS